MTYDLQATLVALRRDDLLREAEDWRRARGARRPSSQRTAGRLLRAALRSGSRTAVRHLPADPGRAVTDH